jgi:hypothetical protein
MGFLYKDTVYGEGIGDQSRCIQTLEPRSQLCLCLPSLPHHQLCQLSVCIYLYAMSARKDGLYDGVAAMAP